MDGIRVILVEPKNEGNVGAIARVMRNFDVEDLVLVKPCSLGDVARRRAMHGLDILGKARIVDTLEEASCDVALLVATTGIDSENEKRFVRLSVTPQELAARTSRSDGILGLLFGREDYGLLDVELSRCDLLVTIPASKVYPILNVSHAAAVLLYELFKRSSEPSRPRRASGMEKEVLHGAFEGLLDATDYPIHKRPRTRVMFRRLLGRAVPSKWEFHALVGVFQRATKRIRRLEARR